MKRPGTDAMGPGRAKRQAGRKKGGSTHEPNGERGDAAVEADLDSFTEAESVRAQAREYLLGVAMLPLSALDPTWRSGGGRLRNRKPDPQHVRRLREMFLGGSLDRMAEDHWMSICCSAQTFREMASSGGTGTSQDAEEVVDLRGRWDEVMGDQRVELMEGQHRAAALEAYVKKTGAPKSELWWWCNVYDGGKTRTRETRGSLTIRVHAERLPPELSVRLRANRKGPVLPDNHGQVWQQLVLIASSDEAGPKMKSTELMEKAQLTQDLLFPRRRLVTLWNNREWKKFIDGWCETTLGCETFNVTRFGLFASLRLDEVSCHERWGGRKRALKRRTVLFQASHDGIGDTQQATQGPRRTHQQEGLGPTLEGVARRLRQQ
jgi:hypothetical protein